MSSLSNSDSTVERVPANALNPGDTVWAPDDSDWLTIHKIQHRTGWDEIRVYRRDTSEATFSTRAHVLRRISPANSRLTSNPRTAGDDVIVQVRVRRANLATLEAGVQLGIDSLTNGAIELQLVPGADGIHDMQVVTNPLPMAATPEPVDVERVDHAES